MKNRSGLIPAFKPLAVMLAGLGLLAGSGFAAAEFQMRIPLSATGATTTTGGETTTTGGGTTPDPVGSGTTGFWVVDVTNDLGSPSANNADLFISDLGYQTSCPAGGSVANTAAAAGDNLVYASQQHDAWEYSGNGGGYLTPAVDQMHDVYCIPANVADYDATVFGGYEIGANDNPKLTGVSVAAPYAQSADWSWGWGNLAKVDLLIGGKTYTVIGYAKGGAWPYLTGYSNAGTDSYFGNYYVMKTGIGAGGAQTLFTVTPTLLYGTATTFEGLVPLPADAQVTVTVPTVAPFGW